MRLHRLCGWYDQYLCACAPGDIFKSAFCQSLGEKRYDYYFFPHKNTPAVWPMFWCLEQMEASAAIDFLVEEHPSRITSCHLPRSHYSYRI